MEKNIYKGNVLIRRLVVLADFIILNCLLLGFINFESLYIPDYLDLRTKITFFIANVALAIGEYNYSTIIHIRRIGFQQVLKRTLFLTLCTTVCFMVFLKFFSHEGEIFTFGIYFGISFYEPTLKSKACLKCLYFTKIISALCCYLEYFSYLYTIN